MIALPLWIVPAAPLVLLALLLVPQARPALRALVPLAPLPALAAALASPAPAPVTLDWLMLGTELALTDTARPFLGFTAALWALAGWQALRLLRDAPGRDRFLACFLLAMTGNLGLLVAQDIAAFYSFFAAMSLASWGLVLQGGGAAQVFAGRVYIGFAVTGELALFAGLSLGAFATGETRLAAMAGPEVPALATALMAAGLLVKLGAVPLHLWLPLAHAAAPAPASAVLSGAMLKAGLFGLMTVLPLGSAALPGAAAGLAAMALAGLVLAPALGLVQAEAKAVLAYSSIGQMSLMALGLAAGLAAPAAWPLLGPAVLLLAVHHAFAKAALFLGVPAVWSTAPGALRAALLAALALLALALAGLPATSGAIAKTALKEALEAAPAGWQVWLGTALFAASLGTALLMLRALWLLADAPQKPDTAGDVALPWLGATGLVLAAPWLLPGGAAAAPDPADLVPPGLAAALALAALALVRSFGLRLAPPKAGELLGLFEAAPRPAPVLALPPPPRRGRTLVVRRGRGAVARPERGALAILGVAAALALVMALAPAGPAPVSAPPAPVTGEG
ncbi:proton-conducting transporter transmembrane domain-containing protein [Pseudoponticoccus marisrubri]|uniref:NADH:quinone oxidoreductase/Mrp antiporter transmembrane domain-containing protein n=1 Tax=Pseudoponticoccus marisrubri TaxID=1685382 RepID=A0A0W7WDV4_9RHOB|nr:proton-conducting transporter membrane subunit [Pseudoponticoccus marisrubri]KUF08749.1 hypothetical protein AVJ23_21110 [Pseudoponticoccus marisrubri]